jgi:hypothetical protein
MPVQVQVQAGGVHDLGRSRLVKTKDLLSAIVTPKNLYTVASVGLSDIHDLREDYPVGGHNWQPKKISRFNS